MIFYSNLLFCHEKIKTSFKNRLLHKREKYRVELWGLGHFPKKKFELLFIFSEVKEESKTKNNHILPYNMLIWSFINTNKDKLGKNIVL
jgi:hypothetical protein